MNVAELLVGLVGEDPLLLGLVGGAFIALCNTLGALAVVLYPDPDERTLDTALGFAAGVMLSASFTSLLLPGIELGGPFPVFVGFALGVVLLDRADGWVPNVQRVVTGRNVDPADGRTAAVVLFIVAITLHNAPEGLAVGVAFGTGDVGNAVALMLAIGIQNVPEGLAVSVAARSAGLGSYFYAAVAGVRAGLVEIPLAVVGAVAAAFVGPVVPYAMGFAAGGMLFVISHEIVPETHARGHEHVATAGMMVGVAVMLYLDVMLG
jgi:ZIP family zinc transporter